MWCTRSPRVGQESASWQAVQSWCSSDKGLMGSRVMGAGESNCVRDYKRLGEMAKLATTYIVIAGRAAKRWTNACHFCPRHFSAVSRHDRLQSGCDKRCTHVE